MSVKMKTINSNFQNSLRSSKAKLSENQKESEGLNGKNSIIIKKQPIEFPEKYIFAINPNNPNYKKTDMLYHFIHNGKNPQKEISHLKRTNSCSNSISNIAHMVGQEEHLFKPIIRLKHKIIENNKESLIKVKRKKDYSVLFFEKENFENKLNKQGSVKDLYSNPFSEERDITKYGIEIGKYQQHNRSNSASNLRTKSTRDYFYNSNQFIDCLPNKNKKTHLELGNKISFENMNTNKFKKEFFKEIKQPASDLHVKDLFKPIPRLLNKEISSKHKSNIKVNNSTSIYKIFNNKEDSKINMKNVVIDKIYNTHFNLFDNNTDINKKYNHKSFQVFKDNKVCFY